MNRWFGSAQDSADQASARDRRAAQRFIKTIPKVASASEDEEDFKEANTSFTPALNVDGESEERSADQSVAAMAPDPVVIPFQDADAADDAEAWKKELKLKFEPHDVNYWFNWIL